MKAVRTTAGPECTALGDKIDVVALFFLAPLAISISICEFPNRPPITEERGYYICVQK